LKYDEYQGFEDMLMKKTYKRWSSTASRLIIKDTTGVKRMFSMFKALNINVIIY
jgi:hypothetical protein